jgi:hypothetical protein
MLKVSLKEKVCGKIENNACLRAFNNIFLAHKKD